MKANTVRAMLGPFLGLALLFCSGASFAALMATEVEIFHASEGQEGDVFGHRVALEGDTAMVVSWWDDDFAATVSGAFIDTPIA